MSLNRIRLNPKSKRTISAPTPVQRLAPFGPPLLLQGEDAAAYDALLGRIYAAVKPVDIIDEMFVDDLVFLEWEVLRWRRLKSSLIRARGIGALEEFLRKALVYDLYRKEFEETLVETLLEKLAEDQDEGLAQKLARQYVRNEPGAAERVDECFRVAELNMDIFHEDVKTEKLENLAQGYARRDLRCIKEVHELLDAAGRTMDDLIAEALAEKLDNIERIDRITTIAETRRNASLHEIDRRRTMLGEALRRSVQEVEDGEFEVIETTPAKGKSAA